MRHEGFFETLQQVRRKLDEPMAMGYASAGTVLACGAGVREFKPGGRVAGRGRGPGHGGRAEDPSNRVYALARRAI